MFIHLTNSLLYSAIERLEEYLIQGQKLRPYQFLDVDHLDLDARIASLPIFFSVGFKRGKVDKEGR
jgi:hypothetical protein